MAKPVHTGDLDKIYKWFLDNPEKNTTSVELAELFGLERWQVNNAISQLVRTNRIARGERFSIGRAHYTHFHLRKANERREEFKVSTRAAIKNAEIVSLPTMAPAPVFVGKVHEELWAQIKTPAKNGCVQILNATTAIIWNSPEQKRNMMRMAVSH